MARRSLLTLVLGAVFVVLIQGVAQARETGNVATFELPGGAQIEMVWIEPGTFMMGTTEEQKQWIVEEGTWELWMELELPAHQVTITKGFWMGKYEVTNSEYCVFLNDQGNQSEGGAPWLDIDLWRAGEKCLITRSDGRFEPKSGYGDHPVIQVRWYGAKAYCEWAGGRLPTEAEWEYAARGGLAGKRYPWGDEDPAGARCNYWSYDGPLTSQMSDLAYGRGTLPVGRFDPNGYGLYDMAGNVWEWCNDWYENWYYGSSPSSDPPGPSSGADRVQRGGGWGYAPEALRCAARGFTSPIDHGYAHIGFRICKTASEERGVTPTTWGAIKAQF